jgi:rhamnose utilization protein RhaD (predicted bifunctional aldolase and dehydrogenase)
MKQKKHYLENSLFGPARFLGASPLFTQGAGGNISIKVGSTMYVKASGVLLRDLAHERGYVGVGFEPVARYLDENPGDARDAGYENDFNRVIEGHALQAERFGVPSIETGMHVLLSASVIHTHNVYANVLGCMAGGDAILRDLFREDALIIPYVNPGYMLAHALLEKKKKGALPPIIFLTNHGMITHDESAAKNIERTTEVTRRLEAYLKERGVFEPFEVRPEIADFSKHFFPDSVVYSQINPARLVLEKQRALHEISSAVLYILRTIQHLHGTPVFLPSEDVSYIQNMEKEKMRLQMAL